MAHGPNIKAKNIYHADVHKQRKWKSFHWIIHTALHGYFTRTQFRQNCRDSCINFSENCQSIGNPVNSPTMLICHSIDTNWISSCRSDGGWYCRESDDTETESSSKKQQRKGACKTKNPKTALHADSIHKLLKLFTSKQIIINSNITLFDFHSLLVQC